MKILQNIDKKDQKKKILLSKTLCNKKEFNNKNTAIVKELMVATFYRSLIGNDAKYLKHM